MDVCECRALQRKQQDGTRVSDVVRFHTEICKREENSFALFKLLMLVDISQLNPKKHRQLRR